MPANSATGPGSESFISPQAINDRAEFAEQLRLRLPALDLPLRSLAAELDLPVSTLNGWMNGRHLPNQRQVRVFRTLLVRLGVHAGQIDAWVEALSRVRRSSRLKTIRVLPFDDAGWVPGRDRIVRRVLDTITNAEPGSTDLRLFVVVSAADDGESPRVRAGVAASPTTAGPDPGAWAIMILDRFEDVLARRNGGPETQRLLDELTSRASDPSTVPLVIARRVGWTG